MLEPLLTPDEARVLGCLIEKEATTPDAYPLTVNSLRNACNQSTSRDPVMTLTDLDVERALGSLRERGLTRTVHSTSNRATKYRHAVPETLELEPADTALLAVLLLRGAQTGGELKTRSARLYPFVSVDEVATVLRDLAGQSLVRQLARQPGQKDARWVDVLSPVDVDPPTADASASPVPTVPDHLATVFDHGRLRIELGARPGDHDGNVDLRVTVGGGQFGGTLTCVLVPSDLERLLADLDAGPAGRFRLGGGQAPLVELCCEPDDGVGPALRVECSIVVTEEDPQEWLQFLMFGVAPFAADTAARVRAVLAESGRHAASDVPGDRSG